jgi:hypothetical protein
MAAKRPAHTRDPAEVAALRSRVKNFKTGVPDKPIDAMSIRRSVFRILFPTKPNTTA